MNSVLHKSVGNRYRLFIFDKDVPGQVCFLPKGVLLLDNLKAIIKHNLLVNGYRFVETPTFGARYIWEKTGHISKYSENMFKLGEEYYVKPMNCPLHMLLASNIYANSSVLPIKLSEFGYCFRNECTGSLSGLFRLFRFVQDDSHVVCGFDSLESVIDGFFSMVETVYKKLDLYSSIKFRLSTVNESYIGTKEQERMSCDILRNYLTKKNLPFFENADGAFYGPKIDIIINDSQGREWQTGTIQIDMCLLKNIDFGLQNMHSYDNCLVVHHAVLGTFERFLSVLLENQCEDSPLPPCLNPHNTIIVTPSMSGEISSYIEKIKLLVEEKRLMSYVDFDLSQTDLREKLKKAHHLKYKYICVVGAREAEKSFISVTDCIQSKKQSLIVEDFFELLNKNIYEQRYTV